jgi:hypothetical protein
MRRNQKIFLSVIDASACRVAVVRTYNLQGRCSIELEAAVKNNFPMGATFGEVCSGWGAGSNLFH